MYRFYTPSQLSPGLNAVLDTEELHHLSRVLRVKPGDKIELVNGRGDLALASFQEEIRVLSVQREEPIKTKSILIQALPEKHHLEFILEKATELGITDFWIFPSEKSKIQEISDAFVGRMKKITISALKQSKRLFLPDIQIYRKISDIKKNPYKLYLADPKGAPFTPETDTSRAFIVGPESGFTQKENLYFQEKLNAIPTTLSKNVLRTETAAIISSFLISSNYA
jgi:16S rRNA (uracil1498-N3)-methyltransferase